LHYKIIAHHPKKLDWQTLSNLNDFYRYTTICYNNRLNNINIALNESLLSNNYNSLFLLVGSSYNNTFLASEYSDIDFFFFSLETENIKSQTLSKFYKSLALSANLSNLSPINNELLSIKDVLGSDIYTPKQKKYICLLFIMEQYLETILFINNKL
jgi:hypothetical protein